MSFVTVFARFPRLKRSLPLRVLPALLAMMLSACAVGPDYKRPDVPLPPTWQAALPHGGQEAGLIDWWSQFNDPALVQLLQAAETDSPTLERSAAIIAQSRAAITVSRSAYYPQLSGRASSTAASATPPLTGTQTTTGVAIDAAWEIDLFGSVQRSTEAATARLQGAEVDWHLARVSLAAEVASNYTTYRACQKLVAAIQRESDSRNETARLTAITVGAGFTSPADGNLAKASAAAASGSLITQSAQCDLTIKSLVALSGMSEPAVRTLLGSGDAIPVPAEFTITSLPVAVISQRPDVASAERTLAAANAEVGVAEANRYPRLSLTGSISYGGITLSGKTSEASAWSFGPALTVPLFDAGRRRAQVTSAQASYDQALANYRQVVRNAVKEVEQALVNLDSAARRETDAQTGMDTSQRYYHAVETNWRSGGVNLLTLEEARRTANLAEVTLIEVQRDRVLDWITLYKALGGDWQQQSPAVEPPLAAIKQSQAVPSNGETR